MSEFTSVLIGIQARSGSKRFPRKVFETIGGKPMLTHVLNACKSAADYMNKHTHKTRQLISVALLIPEGDEIGKLYRGKAIIYEGPEDDVLSRYHSAVERSRSDYVVRVTADCPLIPGPLIRKHIVTALVNGYDYTSNVFETFRTAPDGYDCEVLSRQAMTWLHETAKDPSDREHVTPLIRKNPPDWAKIAQVVHGLDLFKRGVKLSVDSPDDLEHVRVLYDDQRKKREEAEHHFGKGNVHSY